MRQFLQTVRDLWRDPMGRIGMIGIFLLIVVAIIAPTIAPYGPEQMVAMPQLAPAPSTGSALTTTAGTSSAALSTAPGSPWR